MAQIERVHTGDIFIAAVLIVGQCAIAWQLFTVWKPRIPKPLFRALAPVLACLWIVCAFSIYLNASSASVFSSAVRFTMSAVEILWGFFSAFALVVYFIARKLTRAIPSAHMAGRRQLISGAAAMAVAAPAIAVGYGAFIERTQFHVREVDFPIPNLHPDLTNIRIAQISDIHASPYLSVRQVGRVVDMANELRPNLMLVTGDLISEAGDPLDATIAELARLRAEAGILGCLGNHEMYARCEDYATEEARRRSIDFLRGEARPLQFGNALLNVAGVDFQPFRHKDRYLRGAEKLIVPGASNILLSHNPDVFPLAVNQGYDAVIGGHTHGGQVTVEIVNQALNFARFFTPYVAGLYRLRERSCYVTAGIGTIGAPVRVGAPPEITLLRLRRA